MLSNQRASIIIYNYDDNTLVAQQADKPDDKYIIPI